MKSSYDAIPSPFVGWSDGQTLVNYNVREVTADNDGEARKCYECDSVVVDGVVTYPKIVEAMVRERYTVSDELSILRQQSSKAAEFEAYNSFVEGCKAEAKRLLSDLFVE